MRATCVCICKHFCRHMHISTEIPACVYASLNARMHVRCVHPCMVATTHSGASACAHVCVRTPHTHGYVGLTCVCACTNVVLTQCYQKLCPCRILQMPTSVRKHVHAHTNMCAEACMQILHTGVCMHEPVGARACIHANTQVRYSQHAFVHAHTYFHCCNCCAAI